MCAFRNSGTLLVLALLAASPAAAQMGMMGVRPPEFRGVWSPAVGSGAAYQANTRARQTSWS